MYIHTCRYLPFLNFSIIIFNYYRYVYLPTYTPSWEGFLLRPPSGDIDSPFPARDLSLLDSTVGALLKLGPSLTQHTSALPSMSLCLIGHEIISGFLKENDYPNIYSF